MLYSLAISEYASTRPNSTLNDCSAISDIAVGLISCMPWKYPLYEDITGTSSRAIAVAFMESADPGMSISSAICFPKISSTRNPITPSTIMSVLDILKTLSASLNCPFAHRSDTIFDIATGSPAVETTSRKLYSAYAGV